MSTEPLHIADLPTAEITAISLEEETRILPTIQSNTPFPDLPLTPFVLTPERADCGHTTRSPRYEGGTSICPSCWTLTHCMANACTRPPIWRDARGYRWCAYHERGGILITIGAALSFKQVHVRPDSDYSIPQGLENWLFFTKGACEHPTFLAKAVWSALREMLLLLEEGREEEGGR